MGGLIGSATVMQMTTKVLSTLWGLLLFGAALAGSPRPAAAAELLVFDWNGPVTQAERGFPWDHPPRAGVNGDWTTPHDFANGTVHCRVEIRSQPTAQDMNLQFCFWQAVPDRETCESHHPVKGTAGTVLSWSSDVSTWWKKDDLPVDWTQPRDRNGVAIKDTSFQCVSDYAGWNWNGHDPADWYPLDLRFTVVVVSKGSTFSGWTSYIGTTPPPPDAGSSPDTGASIDRGVAPGDASSDALPARLDGSGADLASTPVDASGEVFAPKHLTGSSGCGVTLAPVAPATPWLAWPLLLLVVLRRRR